jgi:hypothetical protein
VAQQVRLKMKPGAREKARQVVGGGGRGGH